jgi:hypothetical protein
MKCTQFERGRHDIWGTKLIICYHRPQSRLMANTVLWKGRLILKACSSCLYFSVLSSRIYVLFAFPQFNSERTEVNELVCKIFMVVCVRGGNIRVAYTNMICCEVVFVAKLRCI